METKNNDAELKDGGNGNISSAENLPGGDLPGELAAGRDLVAGIASSPPRPVPALEQSAIPAAEKAEGKTDYLGRAFRKELHKVDSTGNPVLTKDGKLAIRKEAKKNTFKKRMTEFFHGKKPEENEETGEEQGNPLSDEEFQRRREREAESNLKEVVRHSEILASARSSAELYFFGGMTIFGTGFLAHKDKFFQPVADQFAEYERRTGRRIDLPPGLSLAVGLGSISWAVIKSDEQCRERFDTMAEAVRENVSKHWSEKIGILRFFQKPEPEAKEKKEEKNDAA